MIKDEYFDIFPNLVSEHIDELYSGELHKGRFIGLYMEKIKKLQLEDYEEIQFKYPQFVSQAGEERSNNWLDFIINLEEHTFKHFKRAIK